MSPVRSDAEYQALFMEKVQRIGHAGIAGDEVRRIKNIDEYGEDRLCEKCSGTGNRLYAMYQKCPTCDGTGINLPSAA